MRLENGRDIQLAEALGIEVEAVDAALKALEEAAVEEYFAMVLGEHTPQRIEDLREYRLLLLTRTLFAGKLPDEETVSRLFHLTRAQSRALIRRTLATYRIEFKETIASTVADIISTAELERVDEKDCWVFTSDAQVVSTINELLSTLDARVPPIRRRPNTIGQFLMQQSARTELSKYVGH